MSKYLIGIGTKMLIVFEDKQKDKDYIEGCIQEIDSNWLVIETDYGNILYINRDKIKYMRKSERDS